MVAFFLLSLRATCGYFTAEHRSTTRRRPSGTAILDLIVEYFRDRGVGAMWTSSGQGEGNPLAFYERYGFTPTGDPHGDEVLRLEIASSDP
jgi:GNAT superfamily N-acetyltransferase